MGLFRQRAQSQDSIFTLFFHFAFICPFSHILGYGEPGLQRPEIRVLLPRH
jgi:hypothetical protein